MYHRITFLILLGALAVFSAWILNRLTVEPSKTKTAVRHAPDYYMEDFTTLTMDEKGKPKNKLYAIYMAHYPDNDTSELLKPAMEFYRLQKPPLNVTADRGWVTENNTVVLLNGNVELREEDASGNPTLQVNTDKARVLVNQNYAETDEYAKIVSHKSTVTGIGMQAFFDESRLIVLSNVHTVINKN